MCACACACACMCVTVCVCVRVTHVVFVHAYVCTHPTKGIRLPCVSMTTDSTTTNISSAMTVARPVASRGAAGTRKLTRPPPHDQQLQRRPRFSRSAPFVRLKAAHSCFRFTARSPHLTGPSPRPPSSLPLSLFSVADRLCSLKQGRCVAL